MFNKISLLSAFIIIITFHVTLFSYINFEKENKYSTKQNSVKSFVMKRVVIKEAKKVTKKIEQKNKKRVVKQKLKLKKTALRKVEKKKIHKEKKLVQKKEEVVKKIKVVEKIVVKEKVAQKNSISLEKKKYLQNEYISLLKAHIEKYKYYPKRAKRLKQEGRVNISFTISKNGDILGVKFLEKCPYKRLNKAAIEIFDKFTSFKPIPKELNKNSWDLNIPIEYSIINI